MKTISDYQFDYGLFVCHGLFKNMSDEQQRRYNEIGDSYRATRDKYIEDANNGNLLTNHFTGSMYGYDYFDASTYELLTHEEFNAKYGELQKTEDNDWIMPENVFYVLTDFNLDDYMHSPYFWVEPEQWRNNHPTLCLWMYFGNPCDCPNILTGNNIFSHFVVFADAWKNRINYRSDEYNVNILKKLFNAKPKDVAQNIVDNHLDEVIEIMNNERIYDTGALKIMNHFYKECLLPVHDLFIDLCDDVLMNYHMMSSYDQYFIDSIYDICQVAYENEKENGDVEYEISCQKDEFRNKLYEDDVREFLGESMHYVLFHIKSFIEDLKDELIDVMIEKQIGHYKEHIEFHEALMKDWKLEKSIFDNNFSLDDDIEDEPFNE